MMGLGQLSFGARLLGFVEFAQAASSCGAIYQIVKEVLAEPLISCTHNVVVMHYIFRDLLHHVRIGSVKLH
jgi:hypothetical protein